jgi:hypothetical protein
VDNETSPYNLFSRSEIQACFQTQLSESRITFDSSDFVREMAILCYDEKGWRKVLLHIANHLRNFDTNLVKMLAKNVPNQYSITVLQTVCDQQFVIVTVVLLAQMYRIGIGNAVL